MTKLQKDLENGFKIFHESFQKCFCKNFVGEETSEKIGRLQERKKSLALLISVPPPAFLHPLRLQKLFEHS